MRKETFAFTLAEVLITLGIIGVVAAITIPSLIQKHQEKVTVTRLKKNYSIMQQAYQMAINDKGTPDNWDLIIQSPNDDEHGMLYHLKDYLKFTKYCGTEPGCWQYGHFYGLNGKPVDAPDNHYWKSKAILADGSLISVYVNHEGFNDNYRIFAIYSVDINGNKGPNIAGKDVFSFYFAQSQIRPFGISEAYPFEKYCNKSSELNSIGCAAWVLQNENMDYLHCDDLSWSGKSKCK